MCYTERFQQNSDHTPTRTWTFRTVHIKNGTREDVQTLHFDCGHAECSIAIAWRREKVMSLKLHVSTNGDLPHWDEEFEADLLLKLYFQTFHNAPDGIPSQLREFLHRVPEMIELIEESNGDILSVPSNRFTVLDQQLSGVA